MNTGTLLASIFVAFLLSTVISGVMANISERRCEFWERTFVIHLSIGMCLMLIVIAIQVIVAATVLWGQQPLW